MSSEVCQGCHPYITPRELANRSLGVRFVGKRWLCEECAVSLEAPLTTAELALLQSEQPYTTQNIQMQGSNDWFIGPIKNPELADLMRKALNGRIATTLADRDALWRRAIETVFNVVFSGYARSTRRQWSEDIAREVARLSAATGGGDG